MVRTIKRGIALICFSAMSTASAQTCGFGCVGMAGVTGGYSVQYFSGDVNNYIHSLNSYYAGGKTFDEIKFAKGFQAGIKLLNVLNGSSMLSVKAYVNSLKANSEGTGLNTNGNSVAESKKLNLELTSYGLGIEYGYSISRYFAVKIIDASVSFNSAKFDIKSVRDNADDGSYKNGSMEIGYSAGAGIVCFLYKRVVSLEATAGYKYFSIPSLENDNGNALKKGVNSQEDMNSFIKSGGVEASVQLSCGIPF